MCDNKVPKKRNFVAKYLRRFNTGGAHRDKMKYSRKRKHNNKGGAEDD